MIYKNLPPLQPLANGVRATIAVPRFAMTLGRIVLCFPQAVANGITKASISEIVVKIGARVVFGPISGLELDKLNSFRGLPTDSGHLVIDFTERDGLTVIAKEMGGIDLMALGNEDVFIEVANNYAGASALNLYAKAGYTNLQFDPRKPNVDGQLIHKILGFNIPTSGGNQVTWTPNLKGAQIKRVHFAYGGTDWTATVDGNLKSIECKKNGVGIWEMGCLDNRFVMTEQRKVPQSRMYHLDFTHDNVFSSALDTRTAQALEFNLNLTAPDTIKAFVECYDLPANL